MHKTGTVQIEKTGKKWKKLKLLAVALVIGGAIIAVSSPAIGATILFSGLCCAIYSGIGGWWNHG